MSSEKPVSHIHVQAEYNKRYNFGKGCYYLEYKGAIIKRCQNINNAESLQCTTLAIISLALERFTKPSIIHVHTKEDLQLQNLNSKERKEKLTETEVDLIFKIQNEIIKGKHEIFYDTDLDEKLLGIWDARNEKLVAEKKLQEKQKRYEDAAKIDNTMLKNINVDTEINDGPELAFLDEEDTNGFEDSTNNPFDNPNFGLDATGKTARDRFIEESRNQTVKKSTNKYSSKFSDRKPAVKRDTLPVESDEHVKSPDPSYIMGSNADGWKGLLEELEDDCKGAWNPYSGGY